MHMGRDNMTYRKMCLYVCASVCMYVFESVFACIHMCVCAGAYVFVCISDIKCELNQVEMSLRGQCPL